MKFLKPDYTILRKKICIFVCETVWGSLNIDYFIMHA